MSRAEKWSDELHIRTLETQIPKCGNDQLISDEVVHIVLTKTESVQSVDTIALSRSEANDETSELGYHEV